MSEEISVDFDKILEYKGELTNYKGFLPLLIRNIIITEWSRNLYRWDLYDTVMSECVESKPHSYDDAVKELMDWVKDNNEYKDIIKKIK